MKCAYCDEPAAAACTWPVLRFANGRAFDVRHGDRIRFNMHSGVILRVLEIAARDDGRLGFTFSNAPHGTKQWTEWWPENSPLQIERPGPCNAAICEAHARELCETKHVCANHWNAWQEAA